MAMRMYIIKKKKNNNYIICLSKSKGNNCDACGQNWNIHFTIRLRVQGPKHTHINRIRTAYAIILASRFGFFPNDSIDISTHATIDPYKLQKHDWNVKLKMSINKYFGFGCHSRQQCGYVEAHSGTSLRCNDFNYRHH